MGWRKVYGMVADDEPDHVRIYLCISSELAVMLQQGYWTNLPGDFWRIIRIAKVN